MEKQRYNQGPLLPGIILIIIGISYLLSELHIVRSNMIWPMFILAPGLGFLALYISSNNKRASSGLIIPGIVTTLIGLFFFYLIFAGWDKMEFLWPIFPFIVGISFFLYFFGNGRQESERGILIPATVLVTVGILFPIIARFRYRLWPLILIVVGAMMLISGRNSSKRYPKESENQK